MRINRRASLADLGVVFLVITVLIGLFALSQSDRQNAAAIGEYQNSLLDSYTVAEGARMYTERAADYSIDYAITQSNYCEDKDNALLLEDFISRFSEDYMDELHEKKNMNLYIILPKTPEGDFFDIELSESSIKIKGDITDVNCLPLKPCTTPKFKINTVVAVNQEYNLDDMCS